MPRRPTSVLYFAYGSNLDARQMQARCPGAKYVAAAVLPDHALAFAGYSEGWGGAVATVRRSPGDQVEGVLYQLPLEDVRRLDGHEGAPGAYRREPRRVLNAFGSWRWAAVYVQPETRQEGRPPLGYLSVMLREYRRRNFDVGPLAYAARFGVTS